MRRLYVNHGEEMAFESSAEKLGDGNSILYTYMYTYMRIHVCIYKMLGLGELGTDPPGSAASQ